LQKLQIDHLAGQPQSIKSSKLDESAIRFSDCKLVGNSNKELGRALSNDRVAHRARFATAHSVIPFS
jgi:hypothetical protein